MPASSSVSRRTASSIASPGSTKPARHDHMLAAKRPERPSRQRSPSIASMMTTGSVRGKCSTLQAGQSRFQPACDDVGRRAAIRAEAMARVPVRAAPCASASGGRCSASTRPCTAIERRSVTKRSSRAFSASVAVGIERDAEAAGARRAGRGTRSRPSARARAPRPGGTADRAPLRAFFSTTSLAADRDRPRRARRSRSAASERRVAAPLGDARRAGLRYSRAAASARDRGEGT